MKTTIVFLLGALMVACSPDAPETMGEACDELAQAICDRGSECFNGTPAEEAACITNAVYACCIQDDTCKDDPEIDSGEEWAACIDAYETFSCTAVGNGALPRECITAISLENQ